MSNRKNFGLSRTVSCSEDAYFTLERASYLTGIPMGQLVSALVEKHLDPRNNPVARAAAREVYADILA